MKQKKDSYMNTATVLNSTDWSSAFTYVGVLGSPQYQDMELQETSGSVPERNRVMPLNVWVTISLPTHEFIQDLDVPGWCLLQPLLIKLEKSEDGTFVVSDYHSIVYGIGDTPNEARTDYVISLIEYYELVSARAGPAKEPNSQLLQRLQRFLLPTTS
jgi:hypothetical protein